MKALCTQYDDTPQKASRPFDLTRVGFVMGKAQPCCCSRALIPPRPAALKSMLKLSDSGASDDAYHMVAPLESGAGAASAMRRALKDAGVSPEKINHISAHGTSTHANDAGETRANQDRIWRTRLRYSHLREQVSDRTHARCGRRGCKRVYRSCAAKRHCAGNYQSGDSRSRVRSHYMSSGPRKLYPEYAMVNAFGFGGTNASVVYKRFED